MLKGISPYLIYHSSSFSTNCFFCGAALLLKLFLVSIVAAVPAVPVGDGIGLVLGLPVVPVGDGIGLGLGLPVVPVGDGMGLDFMAALGCEGKPGEPAGCSGGFECR